MSAPTPIPVDHGDPGVAAGLDGSGPVDDVARRRPRTVLWVAVSVGLVAALLVAVLATRRSASDAIASSPLLGQPAPEIEGPDLDGKVVRLSDMQGSFVVVNFFATWCVPCIEEHPDLVRFSQRHRPEEARVLGVIYDDQPSDVRRFFSERGGTWPVVDDPGSKVNFGVRGVPESFLVSPDGIVLSRIIGGVTYDGLERLLGQVAAAGAGGR